MSERLIMAAGQKPFEFAEVLPWQHLGGPPKKYLLNFLAKAIETTENTI